MSPSSSSLPLPPPSLPSLHVSSSFLLPPSPSSSLLPLPLPSLFLLPPLSLPFLFPPPSQGKDDLRQDAVMQQVFVLVNRLLRKEPATCKRRLSIRTYKVCLSVYPMPICLFVFLEFAPFPHPSPPTHTLTYSPLPSSHFTHTRLYPQPSHVLLTHSPFPSPHPHR